MRPLFAAACLLLLLCAAPLPARADKDVTREAFTRLFIEELQAQAPELTLRADGPLRVVITTPEGGEARSFLDNAYGAYLQDTDRLSETLRVYAAGLRETWQADDALDQSRIVPVVKDTAYLAEIGAQMTANFGKPWQPAWERYNDALVIVYAEDSELQTRYPSAEELDKSGFAQVTRLDRARENLKALLPKLQVFADDGFYWVTAGGDYDASLLLFEELWRNLTLPLEGELIAAVPARNALLITGSGDSAGLAALKRMVAQVVATDSYRLTDQLFVFREGKFEPYGG